MEWLWSVVTAIGGWLIGHWQSNQDWKRGIKQGAQAAFDIESELASFLFERDRLRVREAFGNVDLTDVTQVRKVALIIGEIYSEIIRRRAFADAMVGNIREHDREAWKRTFDEEMPEVGYSQGYLRAIKDVIAGAEQSAEKYFEPEVAAALVKRIDESQRVFAGSSYMDIYEPDGKALGAELLVEVVCRTFDRAEKERGARPLNTDGPAQADGN